MNIYRTYITSSTIMISTKRQKSKFRKVSAADAAGKYDQTIILLHRICIRGLSTYSLFSFNAQLHFHKIKYAFKAVAPLLVFPLLPFFLKEIIFQVFGGILMGCINGKSPLTEEDMNYIARNTAMEKDAVEVILDENLDEKVHSP